jgi:hypothetical protein
MYHIRLLVCCVAVVVPRLALAQACGSVIGARGEEIREAVAPIFFDSAEADIREGYVRKLAPGEIQQVVRDDSVCPRLVELAVAHMRATNTRWSAHQEGGYEFVVLQFGPYYAVSLTEVEMPPRTGLDVSTGWSPLMVFRAVGLNYVHTFAH